MADAVKNQNLSALSMPELLMEEKKLKTLLFVHQFVVGLVVGVAIYAGVAVYSAGNNGFLYFSLILQLFLIFVFVRSVNAKKEGLQGVRAEIKSRNNSGQTENRTADDSN